MTIELETRLRSALAQATAPSSDYDLNPNVTLPPGRKLRAAAVLVPVRLIDNEPRLFLTKRSSALKHHPGQIAFPGGKKDADDPDIIATALREAREEIGLEPSRVKVLGTLPTHETVTAFEVTPVVGLIQTAFSPKPEIGEVEEVFDVPLSHVMTPKNFSIQSRRWRGQQRRYYAVPFGPYYIWGATARILRAMAAGWSAL